MLILGLGTNQGDRLENLRRAYNALLKEPNITVKALSSIYQSNALLPKNSPTTWNRNFLNLAIKCETTLSPHKMLKLTKEIEQKLGRSKNTPRWSPRVIDIDILVWGEERIASEELTIPHPDLLKRPFALWPLEDIEPTLLEWLIDEKSKKTAKDISSIWKNNRSTDPLNTQKINQRIDIPKLVGILNVTPDSFSDGGKFTNGEKALNQAIHLFKNGAEVIDIGSESTRPNNAAPLNSAQEWQRLSPILKTIYDHFSDYDFRPKISIDTRHAPTAKKALSFKIDYLNDVSGFDDPAMIDLALSHPELKLIFMHQLGIPPKKEVILPVNSPPIDKIKEWGKKKLEHFLKKGIKKDQLILDPGIGFGKNALQSFEILKEIAQLKSLNLPIFVGHSRKSFLTHLTNKPAHERDLESSIISLFLAKNGVDYLRVHNIENTIRAFKVMQKLNPLK